LLRKLGLAPRRESPSAAFKAADNLAERVISITIKGEKMAIASMFCTACGDSMSSEASACPKCGHPNKANTASYAPVAGPPKSRIVAGVLAILLGGLGVHKFYLGKAGFGILYLLFCWTFVPAIIAFIEGIIYLVQDDKTFGAKQGVNVAM
jgi:TM2 domain-containing membrane protein YozV